LNITLSLEPNAGIEDHRAGLVGLAYHIDEYMRIGLWILVCQPSSVIRLLRSYFKETKTGMKLLGL